MTENVRQTAQERVCRPIVAAHEQDTASDGTGPQNGPEGTMEPLAGLRVYVGRHARMDEMTKAVLAGYIDGIEREVADMVPLPVDADGVPIHVGDVMEWRYDNGEFEVIGIGGNTLFYIDKDSGECEWTAAGDKHHHHAPTVEDMLREFAQEMNENLGMYTGEVIDADEWRNADERTIAEYAVKLRLAGEDA